MQYGFFNVGTVDTWQARECLENIPLSCRTRVVMVLSVIESTQLTNQIAELRVAAM